ncbi:hypothetical protein CPC16_006446 [Podila verticillata]|nr:hypothetical protein CPC16_006446 [Podila verticillata]
MVLEAASMATLGNINANSDDGLMALRSLTLEMKTPHSPRPVLPGGGAFNDRPPPPPAAMRPLAIGRLQPAAARCLTLEVQKEVLKDGWSWTQHYWNLILSNKDLIRLSSGTTAAHNPLMWGAKSNAFLRYAAKLKHLKELQGWTIASLSSVWELLEAAPTLETLTVTSQSDQLPDPLPAPNTTLRTLTVHGELSTNSLLDVLGLSPHLSNMTVTTIGVRAVQQPQQFGVGFGPVQPFVPEDVHPRDLPVGANLCKLDVICVGDYDALLKNLPDHVDLTWIDGIDRDDRVDLQLPEHSTRFSIFKANHLPWYINEQHQALAPHDVANELLVTNSRLNVFDSIRHYLRVDEMLRQPWACMGLEWLTCRIVGVDRLNDEEQCLADRVMAPGRTAIEKFQRCHAQHHGVYDRLASPTKLKHLDWGTRTGIRGSSSLAKRMRGEHGEEYLHYDEPSFDILKLSLASGLDRLEALKNLEMIGFEGINYRIGKPELEWMAKAWPKLNLMYGLDKERLYQIEYSKERAALKAHFQQLRPNVVHDSLFFDKI